MIQVFISLVCAHIIGDFFLQPDWMAIRKRNPLVLLLHVLIHAVLAYIFCAQWSSWIIPLGVFLLHLCLDVAKLFVRDSVWTFLVDQVFHFVSLLIVTLYVPNVVVLGDKIMHVELFIGGFILAVYGSGILLAKYVNKVFEDNEGLQEEVKGKGIKNGGRFIGQLERGLIFLFILFGQPAGIGFLVAAKSVLRFGETKENQKIAEYVLVGTFLSFGLAIAVAYATKTLLNSKLDLF